MAPIAMFVFCMSGMAVGLAVDCASVPPELLASICIGSDSILASVRTHWTVLPATHLTMAFGALLAAATAEMTDGQPRLPRSWSAIGARACANTVCLVAMLAGMAIGGALAPELTTALGLASSFTGLTAAMIAGMAAGIAMVAPVFGYFHHPRRISAIG